MTQNKIREPALQNIKKTGDSQRESEEKSCHRLNTFLPATVQIHKILDIIKIALILTTGFSVLMTA